MRRLLLVVVLLFTAVVAAQDDASRTPLPFNPFERTEKGEWQSCRSTFRAEGEGAPPARKPVDIVWRVLAVDDAKVTLALSSEAAPGAEEVTLRYPRRGPAFEDLFTYVRGKKISNVKTADENLVLEGRTFACTKVTFEVSEASGRAQGAVWFSTEAKAMKIVRQRLEAPGPRAGIKITYELELTGFGKGDEALFGKKPARPTDATRRGG